ncbi:ATP12 family chaperone protein [Erythrobacter sp. HKB08]|uniref:ATP12 family chaperone protein n=1 Tax=Erythrobacter sp. HKB08 TaxID=2502843 RepID=UPI0010089434|nr:ATP12 family protein [Erythrobacter sp. HKB08]
MKRFYKDVTVGELDDGHAVLLDGRPIKTQGGERQVLPTAQLAEALAEEWRAQGEKIDPSSFRLRDHADYAIDQVKPDKVPTIAKLLSYAETDTLCYRADPGEALFRRQEEMWEPVLTRIEASEGIRFERISGIIHREQPRETLAGLERRLAELDAFTLAGLQAMTSLAASLCVGLSALEEAADPDALWSLANLEEDWQAEMWGKDAEAEARRELRARDFAEAFRFVRLAR